MACHIIHTVWGDHYQRDGSPDVILFAENAYSFVQLLLILMCQNVWPVAVFHFTYVYYTVGTANDEIYLCTLRHFL